MDLLAAFINIDGLKEMMLNQGWWGGAFLSFALLFACGLGLPLPEDIPLIVSGALLCHDPHGSPWQEWAIVGFLNWAGIIGGDICLYWISRRYGQNITRAPIIGKHVTVERIDNVRKMFDKWGVGVVAIGRLFAGIRGAMVITAGTIKFNFFVFVIADSLAAIVSGGLFMLLGWWLGENLTNENIEKYKHYFTAGAIILATVFLVYIIYRIRKHRTLTEAVAEKVIEKQKQHDAAAASPNAD